MFGVVGATGQTGSGVVRQLVSEGKRVRALVRDVDSARAALGSGAELVAVDLLNRDGVRAALDGVTHLYVGLGRAPNLVELEQSVVDAAKAAGVRQYVKCSGIQVGVDRAAKIQQMHGHLEDYVREHVPHTIVAPSFFMQNFFAVAGAIRGGVLPFPTGQARAAFVDAQDIVRTAVAVLGDERHLGRRYGITGPAALSHGDAALAFTQVLGRPVQFVDVPEAAFIAGCVQAGLPPWFAELLGDVYVRFFGSGDADIVTDDVRALTGTAPRSLTEWIRDNARAFA